MSGCGDSDRGLAQGRDTTTVIRTSNKQQASTSQKKSPPAPARNSGADLTQWCPPSTLVFSSRLAPQTAPRRPPPGVVPPKTRAQKDLDRAQGTSVRFRDASWPIGRARHAVWGLQHPAAHPPVWARFGPFLGALGAKGPKAKKRHGRK